MNRQLRTVLRNRELEGRVNQALWSYSPLRESRCPIIVIARGDEVELSGAVRTELMKRTALRLAEAVPGVSRVIDNLVSDESLEQEIRQRLARNPGTHLPASKVTVHSVLGVIYLKGQVESTALREEVAQIAGRVPGVQMVINELTVQDDSAVLRKAA